MRGLGSGFLGFDDLDVVENPGPKSPEGWFDGQGLASLEGGWLDDFAGESFAERQLIADCLGSGDRLRRFLHRLDPQFTGEIGPVDRTTRVSET